MSNKYILTPNVFFYTFDFAGKTYKIEPSFEAVFIGTYYSKLEMERGYDNDE